ncbi:fungal-specific transcription factor domain-containing protein [Mycena crocata]|nr:fungal-specific transcription factor domain-containing protein [Mycena crocata]
MLCHDSLRHLDSRPRLAWHPCGIQGSLTMATTDEEKKRKQQRACDICHKRKIRCDTVTSGPCSSCISLNVQCTRPERRKRGPKSKQEIENGYLRQQLEESRQQVSVLKAQLSLVHPTLVPPATQYPEPPVSSEDASTSEASLCVADSVTDVLTDRLKDELTERLKEFSLDGDRFFGPSSDFTLMRDAVAVKEEYLGRSSPSSSWKRPEFWTMWPWEKASVGQPPRYVFPESDLMTALIELYFSSLHLTVPLLHRPSFERSVREGLHLRNHQFGALVLLVLALGSRLSDDPRVVVKGANTTLSAGWAFFEQVEIIRKSLHDVPSIYEVQLYCLMTYYVHGTSSPQAAWAYLALGIRFLQERGEYRQKRESRKLTVEGELWNRAFWCLLSLDTATCACVGRPPAIHIEDYDVDLPLDVEDEYWENPNLEEAFKQPPGKPSLLSYFIPHIRLCEILSSALRLLYASDKAKTRMGWVGRDWTQHAISELDSAMNEFLGSLPDHLKWDPHRSGDFFHQSAAIYMMYHQLQITIHRPQIHAQTPLAFPSLVICTRAARSCVNIVDVWLKRHTPPSPSLMLVSASFVSGIMLLLNVFSAKRAGGLVVDVEKDLAHVATAMAALKFMEQTCQTAGRAWELLQELRWRDVGPGFKTASSTTKESLIPEAVSALAPDESVATDVPDLWNRGHFAPSAVDMSIEQLLAATAGYDTGGSIVPANQWGDIARVDASHAHGGSEFNVENLTANPMMMDDEVMSMWMAAPSGFGNLNEWHSYISMENAPGFNWSNFDPEATNSESAPL